MKRYVLPGLLVVALAAAGAGVFLLRGKNPASMAPPGATQSAPAPAAPVTPPASCLLPGPPPVAPDGATATAADMKLGQAVIQNFVNQLEAYQACRNSQADNAAPMVSAERKQIWIDQGNAAIDDANGLANAFSVQLKIFKARNPGK